MSTCNTCAKTLEIKGLVSQRISSMAESSGFDPQLALSHKFPETTYTYTERDSVLYALGVGVHVTFPTFLVVRDFYS
nr:enoyl-coa hydratase 2, peroxisomal [Quercus suber]